MDSGRRLHCPWEIQIPDVAADRVLARCKGNKGFTPSDDYWLAIVDDQLWFAEIQQELHRTELGGDVDPCWGCRFGHQLYFLPG